MKLKKIKLITNMRTKVKFLEKDLDKLEKTLEEEKKWQKNKQKKNKN